MTRINSRSGTERHEDEAQTSVEGRMATPLIARFSGRLPAWNAGDALWSDFRRAIFDEVVEAIQETDRRFADDPHARAQKLRELRREHHLIVIAERIRRGPTASRALARGGLRRAASFVLDRSDHIAADGGRVARKRTHLEENMLTSARVNWHKLMRRAGSRAEIRGGWGNAASGLRGTAGVLKKVGNPALSARQRGTILREHIQARLEQLVLLAAQVANRGDCLLAPEDGKAIEAIGALAKRMSEARTDGQEQLDPGP